MDGSDVRGSASWRTDGAIFGAAIGAACLLVELLAFHTIVMLAAVLTGALLGWFEAERVARTGRVGWSIVRMSVLAVLLGDLLVSCAPVGGGDGLVSGLLVLASIGLVVFGLPAPVLTTVAAGVWAVTSRWWLARRQTTG